MKLPDKYSDIFERTSAARLHTLTDCLFALTMIAMFFLIDSPPGNLPDTDQAVRKYLFGQAETLWIALVTFMLMGCYWVSNHNQGRYLRSTDMIHTWLTILYLMFIALLPFPNAMAMRFAHSRTAQIFYSLDLFFIGAVSYLNWIYAAGNRRLVESDLDPGTVLRIKRETLVEPCGALVSIGGAFINLYCWQLSLFLVPVASIVVRKIWGRSKRMI